MLDEAAFLTIEMQDGTKFRWRIPKKFAWKLFLERWMPKPKPETKELPKDEWIKEEKVKAEDEKVEAEGPDEFKLW